MKKFFPLLLCLLLAGLLFAEGESEVKSEIKNVTIFRQGAQVSREATAAVPAGTAVLKFTGIAPNIEKQSIQLKADGSFTVLSVSHQLNYFEEPQKSLELKQLEAQGLELNEKMAIEKAMLQVFTEEESFILSNKAIGGQNTGVQISELRATAEFYRSRLTEIKLKKLELNKTIKTYGEELDKIKNQIVEISAQAGTYTSEVLVSVNAAAATTGSFLLSYVVKNAGWFPNYDIRVKDIQSPADLTYKANVFQTSGEDWNKVLLTLSTGDPAQSGTKPELEPWRLRFFVPSYGYRQDGRRQQAGVYSGISNGEVRNIQGRITDEYGDALIGANILVRGTSTGTITDVDGRYSLQLPAGAQSIIVSYTGYEQIETAINSGVMNMVMSEGSISLSEVTVTSKSIKRSRGKSKKYKAEADRSTASQPVPVKTQEKTTSVEFKISIPYTVKTDGKQATVQIKQEEIPAYYEYYCVPKIDLDAFLTAQITDWERFDLLSGEVNLFFEGTYLGKSYLDVKNLEDTLNISLGRDKNIIVKRTRQKEYTKKQFIGNKRTDTRAWEIEVRNKKKQPVNLVLEDQFPISTTEDIEVTREVYDEAQLEEETGKLTWKVKLEPTKSKKVLFRYAVKYPKKKKVQLE